MTSNRRGAWLELLSSRNDTPAVRLSALTLWGATPAQIDGMRRMVFIAGCGDLGSSLGGPVAAGNGRYSMPSLRCSG
jgi:hypothetical protein